jgi:hypothetical protein
MLSRPNPKFLDERVRVGVVACIEHLHFQPQTSNTHRRPLGSDPEVRLSQHFRLIKDVHTGERSARSMSSWRYISHTFYILNTYIPNLTHTSSPKPLSHNQIHTTATFLDYTSHTWVTYQTYPSSPPIPSHLSPAFPAQTINYNAMLGNAFLRPPPYMHSQKKGTLLLPLLSRNNIARSLSLSFACPSLVRIKPPLEVSESQRQIPYAHPNR